jgi:hypothetical protein
MKAGIFNGQTKSDAGKIQADAEWREALHPSHGGQ